MQLLTEICRKSESRLLWRITIATLSFS